MRLGSPSGRATRRRTRVRPVVVGKPSRAAVQEMGRRLGVSTAEIAVVGDDIRLDVALGRLGGSTTVLVRSGISADLDLDRVPEDQRPDLTVSSVADLAAWL